MRKKKVRKQPVKKFRLQMDFSEKAYRELQSLKDYLAAPSKSEVVRDGLGILRYLVDEIHEGSRILVKKTETGKVVEVLFHFIKRPSLEKSPPKQE